MVGSHSRRRRPGICCSHRAAAAALEQGSGGTVKKRGQKSSLAPGNAALNHLIPPIGLDSQVSYFKLFYNSHLQPGTDKQCCPSPTAVLCHTVDHTALHSCGYMGKVQDCYLLLLWQMLYYQMMRGSVQYQHRLAGLGVVRSTILNFPSLAV